MDIANLALALGSSLTAGLNLYATVLVLGVMQHFDVLILPDKMQVLANPWVLGTAGVLFLIEFVADKVPYVDNTWDAIHSFIRVPAGAVLAVAAVGDIPQHWVWIVALLGGFVSFSAHGAKASTRLAVNSTPEPFSNWFLSIVEDVGTVVILWLVSNYPYVAIAVCALLLALFLLTIYFFYRFFRMIFRKLPRPTQPQGSA
jgi:hypothetical protein